MNRPGHPVTLNPGGPNPNSGRPKGSKNRLTKERVEQELRHIALFDPRALIARLRKGKSATFSLKEIADLPDEVARCISSYDVVIANITTGDDAQDTVVRVRWCDKLKALELCARALGMLKDVHVIEGLDDRKARLRAALAARDVKDPM